MTVILRTVASAYAYSSLAPWRMMPPYSWLVPGGTGDVFERDQGMLKQSQKRTKRAPLTEALMSSIPASTAGWLATMPTERPIHAGEPDDDVFAVVLVDFEECPVVHYAVDYVLDVVRKIRLRRDDAIERGVGAVNGIGTRFARRVVEIVRREEAEQLAQHGEAFGIVVGEKVRHARSFVVRDRPAKLLFGDVFVHDGLDHVWPGDEHVRRVVHHGDEVGDRG